MSTASPSVEETSTLRNRAVGEIRRLIALGELSAEESFSEAGMTAMLGMSRAPVREALVVLAQLGWVSSQPRSGYRVVPMTLSELRDIFVVRSLLEPKAAALAASRFDEEDPEFAPLRIFAYEQDEEGGEDWVDRHYRFHRRIVILSRNRELDRSASETLLKFGRYLRLESVQRALRHEPGEHRRIVDAIFAGDARAAADAASLHIAQAQSTMTQAILETDAVGSAALAPTAASTIRLAPTRR